MSQYEQYLDQSLDGLVDFIMKGGVSDSGGADYQLKHIANDWMVGETVRANKEVVISYNQAKSGEMMRESYKRYESIADRYLPGIFLSHLASTTEPGKVILYFRLSSSKSHTGKTIFFAGINENWRISDLVADCILNRHNLVDLIRKKGELL